MKLYRVSQRGETSDCFLKIDFTDIFQTPKGKNCYENTLIDVEIDNKNEKN